MYSDGTSLEILNNENNRNNAGGKSMKLPYHVQYMEGTPVHCPTCQGDKGTWVTLPTAKIITERIDAIHVKQTVDKCGHTFVFHKEANQ